MKPLHSGDFMSTSYHMSHMSVLIQSTEDNSNVKSISDSAKMTYGDILYQRICCLKCFFFCVCSFVRYNYHLHVTAGHMQRFDLLIFV